MIADLMAAGLQLGWSFLSRPTTPETWGQDIEVPLSNANGVEVLEPLAPSASEYAAMIFTPGAVISG